MSPSTTEAEKSNPVAIEAPFVTVDPGQVIRINARFPHEPKKVLFSFLAPKSDVAVHDPGFGADGTELLREGDLYHYNIDTRGMHGGLGWWYFVSEDADPGKRRAKVGKFEVRPVPRALLERDRPTLIGEASGFDILGADGGGGEDQTVKVALGVAAVIALSFALS